MDRADARVIADTWGHFVAMPARATTQAGGLRVAVELDCETRFHVFVSEHRERAIGLAWRLLGGDRAAAEDVVQEAFVRAHRGLDRFRGDAKMSTWFHRILLNEVQRHRRRHWLSDRLRTDSAPEPRDEGTAPTTDPLLRTRISKALEVLPRGQREAFVLVHLQGFTVRESADIPGRAVGTIKSHLHRALARMRSELADLRPALEREEP
ncbi:MAG: RNA polymerase sigma factor [bacterium]|nr:RNA polymerase sigma factor [bacterium]